MGVEFPSETKRLYGKSLGVWQMIPSASYSFTIQRYNHIPFIIKVSDDTGNGFFSPKTVTIDPTEVKKVTYEDGSGIHCRNMVIMMKDGNRIELETVAFG